MGHVPDSWVLGVLVLAIVIQVSGQYMNIRYLDPWGKRFLRACPVISLLSYLPLMFS